VFWAPMLIWLATVCTVTIEYNYAKTGGREYSSKVTGTTKSRQVSFLVFGATGSLLLMLPTSIKRKSPYWTILIPSLLLSCYVGSSLFWSDDASTTLKRTIVLMSIVISGFGIGKHWSHEQLCWAIIVIGSSLLVLGGLAEIYYGTFLSFGSGYRFSGVMHPAKEAFNCGMLAIACVSLYFTQRRWILLPVAAIALVGIVLTQARTGFIAALLSIFLLLCFYVPWQKLLSGLVGLSILIVIAVAVLGVRGGKADLRTAARMGREGELADPTKLSGRWPIWKETLQQFSERPVLGFGYGAFWTPKRLADFDRKNGWALTHSHCAYIELLVNIGMVGFSLGLGILGLAILRAIGLAVYARDQTGLGPFALALILFACISSITEIAYVSDGFEIMTLAFCIGMISFEMGSTSVWRKQPVGHNANTAAPAMLEGAT